jgi:hypothetical protein
VRPRRSRIPPLLAVLLLPAMNAPAADGLLIDDFAQGEL